MQFQFDELEILVMEDFEKIQEFSMYNDQKLSILPNEFHVFQIYHRTMKNTFFYAFSSSLISLFVFKPSTLLIFNPLKTACLH